MNASHGAEYGVVVTEEVGVLLAGQLEVGRARDVFGEIAAVLDARTGIIAAMHHESRNGDIGQ